MTTLRALLASALLAACLPALGQPDPEASARAAVAEVNGRLATLERAKFTAQRRGVEYTSRVTAWRDASGVRKLEVTDLDDSGSVVAEYYYRDRSLVFVYVAVKGFNAAGREATRVEQRLYFRSGTLVRWLGGMDRVPVAAADPEFARQAKARLEASDVFVQAAALAFAKEAPTVRVGNETKVAEATVVSVQNGDTSCLLELRDDKGRIFHEPADFDLCFHKPALPGKRVAFIWTMANVQAASCGGNPDCGKSERIALVKGVRLLGDKPGAGPPKPAPPKAEAAGGPSSFCTPLEEPIFACRTGAKMVSVCASRGASARAGYVQYRFGKPDSSDPLELTIPDDRPLPPRAATGGNVPYAGGGASWMRFRRGDHAYVVYSGIGKWGPRGETEERAGLAVERAGKVITQLRCRGPVTGVLGPDWFERVGIEPRGDDFDISP